MRWFGRLVSRATTIGVAMAASLYDPAFATLGRIFGSAARAPITVLTLAGGFASTVSWPATQFLIQTVGWRGAYLVYATLLAALAAPLHAFALPRQSASGTSRNVAATHKQTKVFVPAHGFAFVLVAAGFASYAFVPSALSAQLLAIFHRFGLAPATVVAIGMLFGPAQVLARICELSFARRLHPLWIARGAVGLLVAAFVLLALLPFSAALAAIFAIMFGTANGLLTIARGTVPLALFGASGYGRLMGRIALSCGSSRGAGDGHFRRRSRLRRDRARFGSSLRRGCPCLFRADPPAILVRSQRVAALGQESRKMVAEKERIFALAQVG